MEYPQPKILISGRRVASVTVSGLPVTVTAGSIATLTATATGVLSDVQQTHTRIRSSVIGSAVTTDSGGQTKIVVESANLQNLSGAFAVPLSTGSPLGLLNEAAFAGELEWDTDDVQQLQNTQVANLEIVIVVLNTDSSNHNVTAGTFTILIEWSQYADALRTPV